MCKHTRFLNALAVAAYAGLGAAACDDDESDLHITISASQSVASETDPTTLTVSAENRGPVRIDWGMGSSSCQLEAVVRVDGIDLLVIDVGRGCTDDLVPQGLEPGDSRSESWVWRGDAVRDGSMIALPAGTYEVRGLAGDLANSDPISIEVRRSQ
jgi:hypothetical protein